MKEIARRLLSIIICSIVSTISIANITIDGLVYSLNGTEATIIDYTEDVPSDLVIPETIFFDGDTYRVTCIGNRKFGNSSWAATGAFYNCTKLKSITIPQTVTSIPGQYESNPDNAPTLNGQVFYGCVNLESVHFLGTTVIGSDAFYGCTSLNNLIFDNCITIGKRSFWNCTSLKYVVIPSGSIVANDAFYNCIRIQDVICLGDEPISLNLTNVNYYTRNDFLIWSDNSFTYCGTSPNLPAYDNKLPRGFIPTYHGNVKLERIAGHHTNMIPFTFTNDEMSFDVEIPYEYTINPVTLTAHVKDATRQYGDSDPQFHSEYSGFVTGEDESVITDYGSYTTTATKNSDVGNNYSISQSGASATNYVFQYESGTLTITKAPLTMTARDKTMEYGEKVPILEADYVGLKNNESTPKWITEPSITTTATSSSKIGNYPITISDGEAKNYDLTINGGTLTVKKKLLKVKAMDASRLYGENNPELTLSYTGLVNNESEPEWVKAPTITTSATKKSAVGDYIIEVSDAKALNYELELVNGTLSITKAPLLLVVSDATREYGDENPLFQLSYDWLVNDEEVPEWIISPTFMCPATKSSRVGTYPIGIENAIAKNYSITVVDGTLSVTKALLTVSVGNYTKEQGESMPNFEPIFIGFKNGETKAKLSRQPTITCSAYANSEPGEYDIIISNAESPNYEFSYINGKLTVIPRSEIIQKFEYDGVYYLIGDGNKVSVTSGVEEYFGKIVIPNQVHYEGTTYSVTSIGKNAFHRDSAITSVTIPNSVISIGESAFGACTALSSVTIPNSVTEIGDAAFYGCTSLESINLPENINKLGENLFWGCTKLTDVTIPQSVTIIGQEAFLECLALSSITIPDGVTEIGKSAFEKCSTLRVIIIGSGVASIGSYAFANLNGERTRANNDNLKVYCKAETVPETDENAFDGTPTELSTLYVPASAVEKYRAAWPWSDFKEIVPLDNPSIPDDPVSSSFTEKGINYVVKDDGTLEVTGIEDGTTIVDILSDVYIDGKAYQVTSIGERAFEGRHDIEYLSIPWSVTSIGEYAFIDCGSSNMAVNIADPESWCQMKLGNEHSSPLSSAGKMLVHDIEATSISIQETVKSIGAFTFYQCSCIQSLYIPGSVTSIGSSAFEDCDYLTSLTLSDGLQKIGGSTFQGCTRLQTLTIPSTVKSIKLNAFADCKGITDVYCYADIVPETDDIAFHGTPTEKSTLHVPANAIEAYRTTWPWSDFKEIVALDADGIAIVKSGDGNNMDSDTRIYDLQGNQQKNLRKGVNIIRQKDGRVKKIKAK